jgi:secretion/DNA translocation related TadE-like protein
MIHRFREPDDGLATVVACLGIAVLVLVTGLAVQLGAVLIARHRAEVAADLAALSAASLVLGGSERACAAAAQYARENNAELVSCEQESLDVRVEVRVRVRAGPLLGAALGRARAGPVAS